MIYYATMYVVVAALIGWIAGRVQGYRAGAYDHVTATEHPSLRERASAETRLRFHL